MVQSSNSTYLIVSDLPTISPYSSVLDNLTLFLNEQFLTKQTNLTCTQIKYEYISQKPLFNIVRHITHNLNRFFILPAIILNLCAFYILRRTRMNRSSSIAFYMQTLAICDVAFFALRVLFGELSSLSANKHILTTGLCKFLFLMVNAVNYTTVWLIAAMNADKFLAVCLPLRVSDLLSRKKAYAVVIAVIICSMLVASVHASRTVLKNNSYCWLETSQDEKLVFILDAFFSCFVPFIVISILNAAIFLALLRARREASHLHESTSMVRTSTHQFHSSMNNRARIQSQNLQITIMLITISVTFFVLTLPNAIYYLLIFLRVFIESWKAVNCDVNVYRNLDTYVRTSAVMYLISNITSDLMHVVNFFLYFISGARFRNEFRRLIFHKLRRWCCKSQRKISEKNAKSKQSSFIRVNGGNAVRTVTSLPSGSRQRCTSNNSYTTAIQDKQTEICKSSMKNTTSSDNKSKRNQYALSKTDDDDKTENDDVLKH
ncbi:unnamed protein product [Adineta steineri]|uniref:G-protein coupled receptors family 1 profile domain-containing protein n=1 Tax=Adineta steineri TaxID=433720 RepID=A0A818JBG5_9BILA|nr:unnamed protein product [Adineta steineri]CAF1109010.1 unnamed protein product [Adineta steineri]CAF1176321.1 unnamed protein product [Adineta steineri]CAF3538441.1 unnamed protein product [Adineta steineri]CAF3633671.1 unnamed protein product [Adineta steineri]